MPFIDEMPEKKGSSVCNVHGHYEHRYQDSKFGGKILVSDWCVQCVEDEKRKQAEQERLKSEADKILRIERAKSLAGVSKRNINSSFCDFESGTDKKSKALNTAKNWLCKFKEDKESTPSMIITGKVGTGKTLLASCIINELISDPWDLPVSQSGYRRGNNYKIVKLIDMVRMLKETWRKDSEITERELIKNLSSLDLLIIDEVGMGFESDTEKLFVFDVIDGRYQNNLPTILISNLNAEGIKGSIGERAIDRLRDGGGVLVGCDWESYRK